MLHETSIRFFFEPITPLPRLEDVYTSYKNRIMTAIIIDTSAALHILIAIVAVTLSAAIGATINHIRLSGAKRKLQRAPIKVRTNSK